MDGSDGVSDERPLSRAERERFDIWYDIVRMHNTTINLALHQIIQHDHDVLMTMPLSELKAIQRRFTGLAAKLQEVAGRE